MSEHKIPGKLACVIFRSVEEQLGENGLKTLLRRSGLDYYIDNPPPDDDTPTLELEPFKKAIGSVVDLFGEKAAKPLLLRWGKLTFQYTLESQPTMFGLAGLITTFMSEERKMRFILSKVLAESDKLFGVTHILTEDETYFYVEVKNCYYCGGLKSSQCICWQPVGFWTSLMTWITGKTHEVKEIECRAQGKESCKFTISKQGMDDTRKGS
ncbi:MAG: 4-vinyl reductase [Candidatus Methanofastidiosia archaeon]